MKHVELFGSCQQAFFLHRADGFGAELEGYLFAVNNECFGLKIWLPNALGVALGKTDVVAVLFALASDIAFLHNNSLLF